MLIDVATSVDRNAIKNVGDKILKCILIVIEIYGMWNAKAKVIPVLTF